jgi:hypothetical protein
MRLSPGTHALRATHAPQEESRGSRTTPTCCLTAWPRMRYKARMRHRRRRAAAAPLHVLLDGVAVQRPLPQELVGQEPAPSGGSTLTLARAVHTQIIYDTPGIAWPRARARSGICQASSTHKCATVFLYIAWPRAPAVAIAMPAVRTSVPQRSLRSLAARTSPQWRLPCR